MNIREIFRELTRSQKWEMLRELLIDLQADYGRGVIQKPEQRILYKCAWCKTGFSSGTDYDAHYFQCKGGKK